MSDPLSKIARTSKVLEGRFFLAESLVLKDQLARLKREDESAEALAKVSGISNTAVLRELANRAIRPEMLTALCLVPIIEVAWADGIMEKIEIKAILEGARKHGLGEDHAILREWLQRKPDASLFAAWKAYMQGLCEILSTETLAAIKKDPFEHTRMVAEASGSFLGLTDPISAKEKEALDRIASFFKEPGPCNRR